MNTANTDFEEKVASKTREQVVKPPFYKVLLHNDDYTTMEFVVQVLIQVFNKTPENATRIMLDVHNQGIGLCGVYSYEIAETKVDRVHYLAREHGFPLRCSMERE
jgi:ATP-dependent Clp protease adaptor protein ClpS